MHMYKKFCSTLYICFLFQFLLRFFIHTGFSSRTVQLVHRKSCNHQALYGKYQCHPCNTIVCHRSTFCLHGNRLNIWLKSQMPPLKQTPCQKRQKLFTCVCFMVNSLQYRQTAELNLGCPLTGFLLNTGQQMFQENEEEAMYYTSLSGSRFQVSQVEKRHLERGSSICKTDCPSFNSPSVTLSGPAKWI